MLQTHGLLTVLPLRIKDGTRHRLRGMAARGEGARCMANDYSRQTTVENFTVWSTPSSKKPTSSPKSLPTMSSAFFARALTPFRKDSNLIDSYPCPSSPFLTITISGNRTAISSASFGAFFGFHATTNRTEAEFT